MKQGFAKDKVVQGKCQSGWAKKSKKIRSEVTLRTREAVASAQQLLRRGQTSLNPRQTAQDLPSG